MRLYFHMLKNAAGWGCGTRQLESENVSPRDDSSYEYHVNGQVYVIPADEMLVVDAVVPDAAWWGIWYDISPGDSSHTDERNENGTNFWIGPPSPSTAIFAFGSRGAAWAQLRRLLAEEVVIEANAKSYTVRQIGSDGLPLEEPPCP